MKEKKCECCGRTEWLGQPIALELHHLNGIRDDLRIENLQILCPNCHAFTDNYRGKKLKLSAQEEIPEVEELKIGETLTSNVDGNPEPSLYFNIETCGFKYKFDKEEYIRRCRDLTGSI